MKSVVTSMLVAMMIAVGSPVLAAGYGAAGCGPGSMMYKQNTKSEQLMSWVVNTVIGFFIGPVQLYAITTGVSNCGGSKAAVLAQEDERFVAQNFDSLAKEMALGRGESVETLAGLLGCSAEERSSFGRFTQKNYGSLFRSDGTTPQEMLTSLKNELPGDPVLAASCGRV